MDSSIYTSLKVNNEIELCEVTDMNCKQQIERTLLKNRISYFVKWNKGSFFRRKSESCIFCVNDNCPDRVVAKLTHFASKNAMNIEGLSEKTIRALLDVLNVSKFSDLYKLGSNDLTILEGFKAKKINIIQSNNSIDSY